jgi:hypothetical protein
VGTPFLQTFTVTNTGLGQLNLSNVVLSGSAYFSVTQQPPLMIAEGGVGEFIIAYTPLATGTNTATVYVTNNVVGQTPYTFAIRAVAGISAPSNFFEAGPARNGPPELEQGPGLRRHGGAPQRPGADLADRTASNTRWARPAAAAR